MGTGAYVSCTVVVIEPASLTIWTPSGDWNVELGTGGNLGIGIARGKTTHRVAPATFGTSTGLMLSSLITFGNGALGPGGGVGQGLSAELGFALARTIRT